METVKLVVVIPVGPDLRFEFIADTIASVNFYASGAYRIIIVDDSNAAVGERLRSEDPSLHVIETRGAQGIYGGLYAGTSLAFKYALDRFDFAVLLRLDTDALVIGANSEDEAIAYFNAHPDVGVLGSYRVGCDGVTRDFSPPRRQLQREIHLLTGLLLAPHRRARHRFLNELVRKAVSNGYELGEHCLASAVYYSAACIRALSQERFLDRAELRTSRLGDDHLFGLLTMAAGFRMADFATNDLPIGVRWRGLPFAPQELLDRKKKVTHSTRFWSDMNEDQVRDFFRQVRASS